MKEDGGVGIWEGLGLAISHILASPVSTLFLVVYLSRDAGISLGAQGNFLALTFLGLGAASIFQALRGRFIGSGFLALSGFSTPYAAVLLLAAKNGGLPLMAGMTVFAGMVEIAIAPVLRYVRVLFPASVLAVILALIGIYVGELGVDLLTGTHETVVQDAMVHAVAAVIVLLLFGLTVRGTQRVRWLSSSD